MWSFIQYKRLGKEVERNWQASATPRREESVEEDFQGQPGRHGTGILLPDTSSDNHTPSNSPGGNSREHFIVECTTSDDPIDPRNWPLIQRARAIIILVLLVFVQAWAGASDSLANAKSSKMYHVSPVADNLLTAMYLFGIGTGCLFTGPLSQSVGRNPVYLSFTFAYLCFVAGTALSNTFASQIVCRFFVGLSSSATLGINGATVNDLFRPVERALWFPLIAWANVVPPVIAPIVGGWVASRIDLDWRWTEWISLVISGFAFVVAFLLMPETYLPVLLDWKASHIRRFTGDDRYKSKHAEEASFWGRIRATLPLSAKFTTSEPAILALGGYLVLLYILLFSFLSGFDYIFKQTYSLTPLELGTCFASIAIGATAFTLTAPGLYSWSREYTNHIPGASVTPEFRLWPAMATAPLLPISLFWLGWTNYADISIYSGIAACSFFGLVLNAMYVSSYEYIIDSYGEHAAVALSSITMMRYLIAGGMVMAARPMYEGIGVHWTMTVLGCIAVILTPGPYLLRRYGKTLRARSPYAITDVSGSDKEG